MPTATDEKEARRAWVQRNPLRRWREANDYTMADAAGKMGVAFTSVQLWETGGRLPSDDGIDRIAALMSEPADKVRAAFQRWHKRQP